MMDGSAKPLLWHRAAKADYGKFPKAVKQDMGYALYLAQIGQKHRHAKPLKGFGGAGVLEVMEDHAGNTYRAAYTVKFADAVYVLHAFQKKSKSGIATPKHELALIRHRLKQAEDDYDRWQRAQPKGQE